MQYSSRPPFNDDPEPYECGMKPPGQQRHSEADVGACINAQRAPRVEYDRPQRNPTNPILTAYREGIVNGDQIIHMGSALIGAWVGPDVIRRDHVDHAHRVLTRLAALRVDDVG